MKNEAVISSNQSEFQDSIQIESSDNNDEVIFIKQELQNSRVKSIIKKSAGSSTKNRVEFVLRKIDKILNGLALKHFRKKRIPILKKREMDLYDNDEAGSSTKN